MYSGFLWLIDHKSIVSINRDSLILKIMFFNQQIVIFQLVLVGGLFWGITCPPFGLFIKKFFDRFLCSHNDELPFFSIVGTVDFYLIVIEQRNMEECRKMN